MPTITDSKCWTGVAAPSSTWTPVVSLWDDGNTYWDGCNNYWIG